jgi:signal transduction histidine kinase
MNWTTYLGLDSRFSSMGPARHERTEGQARGQHVPTHVLFPDRSERPWLSLVTRHAARLAYVARADPHFVLLRVDTANPQWFGADPSEWTADPDGWLCLVHPDDRTRVLARREEAVRLRAGFRCRYRVRTRDGVATVDEIAEAVSDAGQTLWYGIMVGVREERGDAPDSGEDPRVDPESATTLEELAWEVLAHDLRAPIGTALQVVQTILRMHEMGRIEAVDVHDALSTVSRTLDRAGRITNQILEFAAVVEHVSEQFVRTQLDVLVTDECQQIGRPTVMLEVESVAASAIPPLLRRAVANLVENALQYSPAGARIDVHVWQRNGSAVIAVTDQGPGIPPELRSRIFEPFVRGHGGQAKGVGLGLAVVHRIAEIHGGHVNVRPATSGGSVFELELPLWDPDADGQLLAT